MYRSVNTRLFASSAGVKGERGPKGEKGERGDKGGKTGEDFTHEHAAR